MTLLHPLFDFLPKVLVDEIFSYDPLHREYMKEVFEELKNKHESLYKCDRYDCETNCYGNFIKTSIMFHNFRFCCVECEGEGSSEIRRDMVIFSRTRPPFNSNKRIFEI
jgi:hypothetical protein